MARRNLKDAGASSTSTLSLADELSATVREVNAFDDHVRRTLRDVNATLALVLFAKVAAKGSDAEDLEESIRIALTSVQALFGALQDQVAMGVLNG